MKKTSKITASFLLFAVLSISLLVTSVQAPLPTPLSWHIETLDSDEYAGWNTAIALDSSGGPHISYYNAMNGILKYARWTDIFNLWDLETVDSTLGFADLGVRYLAVDSLGDPHMAFYNVYARKSGGAWSKQYLPDGGMYSSLALDSSDNPHISYGNGYDLKYAMWTGSAWNVETVDTAQINMYICIALDSSNNPHISYRGLDGGVKYAVRIGNAWSIESVDSTPEGISIYGGSASLALDSGDNPHISYQGSYGLRYARRSGGEWSLATVDSSSDLAIWSSIDVDSGNNPHISYSDESNARLRYARMSGGEWSIETVDAGTAGQGNSLALDSNDNPHISYYGGRTVGLKYATVWAPLATGWGVMWGKPQGYARGPAELYMIGEAEMELVITYKGEDYSKTWKIRDHYTKYAWEIFECYNPDYGFFKVKINGKTGYVQAYGTSARFTGRLVDW